MRSLQRGGSDSLEPPLFQEKLMGCCPDRSGELHLILRVLAWITRKIAKGGGAFMGQSERLYAGKHPMLWTVVGIALGVETGEGASPLPCPLPG